MRTPSQVKVFISRAASLPVSQNLTRGQKGAVTGVMNKLYGDYARRRVLGWLFDPAGISYSAKLLTNSQWAALRAWCDFREEDGIWMPCDEFEVEYSMVVDHVLSDRSA